MLKQMTTSAILFVLGAVGTQLIPFVLPVENTMEEFRSTQREALTRVEKYCFSTIPTIRDSQSCKLWLDQYTDRSLEEDTKSTLSDIQSESEQLNAAGVQFKQEVGQ